MIKRIITILLLVVFLVTLVFGSMLPAPVTLAQDDENPKISGLLRMRVEAKLRASEAAPLAEGELDVLQPMQDTGMQVADLTRQHELGLHPAEFHLQSGHASLTIAIPPEPDSQRN